MQLGIFLKGGLTGGNELWEKKEAWSIEIGFDP